MIFPGKALANYDFNKNCIRAYNEIISLNFQEGRKILESEKLSNPGNKIPVFLENYIDFLTLAIGDEQTDFEKLKPNRAERLNYLSVSDDNSAWHWHCQAAVYLQWSFARVKFGEYAMAGLDLSRAYRLLEKNTSKHPGFVPDLLLSGVMNALIGSIPDNYKWATRLMGMDGAIETGRTNFYQLFEIADSDPQWAHLKSEAFFYLSFIEMNLQSDKNHVVALFDRMQNDISLASGPLNCYLKANLCMRIRKNDKAIEILENCEIPDGSYPFHYIQFVLGNAKLFRLDQHASRHFLNYVNHYKGANYIKSAYQRLAWLSLLDGDENAYWFYISLIPGSGHTFVDEDKQAQAESAANQLPDIRLLKARLLFDGGYYEPALETLDMWLTASDLSAARDSVEYLYRKARIYHEQDKITAAKKFYKQTIDAGINLQYYFAGNAALHLGLINENEGNYNQALDYYELCLKMNFTEYRSSIQQKARAGRQRVTEKK
jgi:tetratricopeptide (TPR) repeat protein